VTLGTLACSGGQQPLGRRKQISADQVPQAWLDLTSARLLGIPAAILIALATLR